jgi:solute carrier family 25 S-adenosylmethionine transporter 26
MKRPFAGLLSSLASSFPSAATFWTTYSFSKDYLDKAGVEVPALKHSLAAACGSITTAYVRTPFEVVKSQTQMGKHVSSIAAPMNILRAQGVSGLFVGVTSMIARDIPFDIIQFIIYEYLKQTDYTGEQLPMYRHLINGAVAGGTAAFLTTPIDVAKTRMMVDSTNVANRSIYTTLASLYRSEGVFSLWKAWKVRVLFTTVGGMLFFGTYEGASRFLEAN